MSTLSISVFLNVLLMIFTGCLIYGRWQRREEVKQAHRIVKDNEMELASVKTMLASKRRDTMIAEDRARRNQERWLKFRSDMTRLYALHEFCTTGSDDAMQRVAQWHELPDAEQQHWLQIGRDFVERNYGSMVG